MSILLTSIKHFSLQDGPGLRTVVFLKGCPLRCPWCCNPECQDDHPQQYALNGVTGTYGEWWEPDDLAYECLKDRNYYTGDIDNWDIKSTKELNLLPGGVTFSGGECLAQTENLVPVLSSLHNERIHIAAETSLFIPSHLLSISMNFINLFYVDIKILDKDRCNDIEHGDLDLFLSNLDTLMSSHTPVVVRIPVIGQQTDGFQNRNSVKALLSKYNPLKIELIKEHDFGVEKYRSLNRNMHYHGVENSLMEKYRIELEELGIPVEVRGLFV